MGDEERERGERGRECGDTNGGKEKLLVVRIRMRMKFSTLIVFLIRCIPFGKTVHGIGHGGEGSECGNLAWG